MNTKQMSDLIYTLLADIMDDGYNKTDCVLNTPTARSIFPCRVLSTPLETVRQSINAEPIVKDFQVSIEHWAGTQREAMEMSANTDAVMKEKNFIRTNTSSTWFDETTKKYILRATYENRWYSVNDSFEVAR